jgi:5-hydroxyisourate hydrolase/2-oxo-4-hydroxy-4-carboxy-5-ureidoimidazoline decarboxylase
MKFKKFNKLSKDDAFKALEKCCISTKWIDGVIDKMPFETGNDLIDTAANIWYHHCTELDWKEAFKGHPKIGDVDSLREKYANTKNWANNEQAKVSEADESILNELAHANENYFSKFGYIFIVSASGKTANEMLQIIKTRLDNNEEDELHVTMAEQHKISIIRLVKLIEKLTEKADLRSYITTHVLDTSTGTPGKDMIITMKECHNNIWKPITVGITNNDGRISDLLPPGKRLDAGNYLMVFQTKDYYEANNQKGFYPEVSIQFTVSNHDHYHVPLLINPFGYSTYKGS